MRKTKICCICVVLVVVLAVTPLLGVILPISAVKGQTTGTVPVFSIVWITDTQYLSEYYPSYYNNLCNWIVDNNSTYNIKMVVHTGDIVDITNNQTQWANANESMSILLNNSIPYCWNAGNHDYSSDCWLGDQYLAFNASYLSQEPYWVSSYQDGLSTAVDFNVSGWECLIINIAFDANDSTLNWVQNLLNAYPDAHVIVATHDYLGLDCTYDSWAASLEDILNQYPNVFMTLNGHYWTTDPETSENRTEVGDRWELMWNFQGVDDEMGAESARILTFNVAADTVSVQTYALYENQFLSDSNNNFTLTTDFRNDAAPISTPTPTPTPTQTTQPLTFPSGNLLTVTSDDGESLSFDSAQILSMPTASGLGGYTQYDDGDFYDTGTYIGVPLLYLCNLVGGLTSSSSITEYCSNGYQTTLNYQEVYNATAGFNGNLFNPVTEAEQNPTQPLTLILAYEYNGANLPSDQGNFRVMAVGPEGLVSWGSYSGTQVTELAVDNSPHAMGSSSLTFNTCNSAGTNQSTFDPGGSVYLTAVGLNPATIYPVYVIPSQNWTVGMTIPTPVSTVTISANNEGAVTPTLIYSNAQGGEYDVLIKTVNVNDDVYDSQDLVLTNIVSTPGPAVSVLTFPSGTILNITSSSGQTMSFTAAQLLAMPQTSGLGGYTQHDQGDFYCMGTYTGVSLQYLCSLVGGITRSCDVDVQDKNTSPSYDFDFSYSEITDPAASVSFWFNPTTGAEQTPTKPITLIIAYELNGASLPSDTGPLRDMFVGSQGLVTWGTYSVYLVDTIAVNGQTPPYLNYATCNSTGVAQNTFKAGDNVYFNASGLSASTAYNILVVPYQSSWTVGMTIPDAVSTTTVTTDSSGAIPVTNIYPSAAPGQYDIVVKATSENDGTYDAQDLLITNVVSMPGPGFTVNPSSGGGSSGGSSSVLVAPAVSASPSSIDQGQAVTLSSSAVTAGTPPYTYQWLCEAPAESSFSAISDANSPSYRFVSSVSTAPGTWLFELRVTDDSGSVATSNAVSVVANPALVAPTISVSAGAISQGETSSLTCSVVATGTSPYSYQWFIEAPGASSFTSISGATSATYDFATSLSTDSGKWSFVLQVTDASGSVVNSKEASVTVNSAVSNVPEFSSSFAVILVTCLVSLTVCAAFKKKHRRN